MGDRTNPPPSVRDKFSVLILIVEVVGSGARLRGAIVLILRIDSRCRFIVSLLYLLIK
jgi:hypothetical protein